MNESNEELLKEIQRLRQVNRELRATQYWRDAWIIVPKGSDAPRWSYNLMIFINRDDALSCAECAGNDIMPVRVIVTGPTEPGEVGT